MNRAFFTLYGFIVISIVSVGWGLDQLWRYYNPQDDVSQIQSDLVNSVANQLKESNSFTIAKNKLSQVNNNLDSDLQLFALDEFASSALSERLVAGEKVMVTESDGAASVYFKVPGKEYILVTNFPSQEKNNTFYYILIVVFYSCIALAVFFWVWPLSRDLRKLERQTQLVGKDNLPLELDVHPGSTVYALSVSFQKMVVRIRELISSHKEMTYAVSHELRTPLARMKFALEIASETKELEKIKKQLLGVREDVGDMDQLVNQLLTYAGYEQDEIKLNLETGDISQLISHLIDDLQTDGTFQHINFKYQNRLGDSAIVCEWHLMERAILNLMQNARRFAKSNILVTSYEIEGNYVVDVEDDGPGIPEEDRARVFQSFVRLSSEENSTVRGFGLGLAIVKRILDWHKGKVLAEGSELGGALMRLQWPK